MAQIVFDRFSSPPVDSPFHKLLASNIERVISEPDVDERLKVSAGHTRKVIEAVGATYAPPNDDSSH
jgi:hypothetical protein